MKIWGTQNTYRVQKGSNTEGSGWKRAFSWIWMSLRQARIPCTAAPSSKVMPPVAYR